MATESFAKEIFRQAALANHRLQRTEWDVVAWGVAAAFNEPDDAANLTAIADMTGRAMPVLGETILDNDCNKFAVRAL